MSCVITARVQRSPYLPAAGNDRCGRKVEDDPNEAAGNDQTHNRTNPKEARSKKSMIAVEDDTNMKMMVEL
jgi:hypothetical protein